MNYIIPSETKTIKILFLNHLTFCPRKSVFSDNTAIPSFDPCDFFFGVTGYKKGKSYYIMYNINKQSNSQHFPEKYII